MANLARRLRKLEARLTDISGLAPHSREWSDYWEGKIDQLFAGEAPNVVGRIPVEVVDSIIEGAENARHAQASGRPH